MADTEIPAAEFTVGLIQMACAAEVQANLDTASELIASAAHKGAQVICLQELFASRYFCQREEVDAFDLADAGGGHHLVDTDGIVAFSGKAAGSCVEDTGAGLVLAFAAPGHGPSPMAEYVIEHMVSAAMLQDE